MRVLVIRGATCRLPIFSPLLYVGHIPRVDPRRSRSGLGRYCFIMSKGHCSGAFYSALAFLGCPSPREMLGTFMDPLSRLNGHPDKN